MSVNIGWKITCKCWFCKFRILPVRLRQILQVNFMLLIKVSNYCWKEKMFQVLVRNFAKQANIGFWFFWWCSLLKINLIAVPLFRREPCQHLKVDATEDRERNRCMEVVTTIKMMKWQSCNVNVLIVLKATVAVVLLLLAFLLLHLSFWTACWC